MNATTWNDDVGLREAGFRVRTLVVLDIDVVLHDRRHGFQGEGASHPANGGLVVDLLGGLGVDGLSSAVVGGDPAFVGAEGGVGVALLGGHGGWRGGEVTGADEL